VPKYLARVCTVATSIPSTRVRATDDVEPVERIHVGAQGTGSHSASFRATARHSLR